LKGKRGWLQVPYREHCKVIRNSVVDRAYRNYMKRMVNLGLVKMKSYEIVNGKMFM
jgi:hypothetical protein